MTGSPRIAVNYLTWEISMGPGSARQVTPAEETVASKEGKQ